ncbi:hypothetical protein [Halostagnicola sp. A-GB9-2]|uniref:hypothetical protein n=1 Tax=Halostagnicola sp. A-GB9-2 TaxID=3048066 RepID=UPI0024BFDB34|nr:hypothetical protein [Halostagnicola sp. A-GB9-2]MDJ1432862.1 hypothetical protein [Halostagnicola sp. A-GB9-2]
MAEITRRRVLAVAGATTMGAVAGCTSSGEEDENGGDDESGGSEGDGTETESSETGDQTGTVLGNITVENMDDSSHTVDVLVEFDGEIEDWTSESLGSSGDTTTLERNWPSEPGPIRIVARVDGDEFTEVTPADWNDPDCFNLYVSVRDSDGVTIAAETDSGPCGPGDGDIDDAEEADD